MFKVGDRVRIIKKCSAGEDCYQCPPIGYIGTVSLVIGSRIDLEQNEYMGLHKKQLELIQVPIPLPLPG